MSVIGNNTIASNDISNICSSVADWRLDGAIICYFAVKEWTMDDAKSLASVDIKVTHSDTRNYHGGVSTITQYANSYYYFYIGKVNWPKAVKLYL